MAWASQQAPERRAQQAQQQPPQTQPVTQPGGAPDLAALIAAATQGQQQTPAPTQQQPAGGSATGLENLNDAQLAELTSRIEQARANRPPSLADALEKLGQTLTQQHETMAAAVEQRREGSAAADQAVAAIAEVKQMMRRAELVEAATAAQFANPRVVADTLLGQEGDVASLVASAAASGAFAMSKPPRSHVPGTPGSAVSDGLDPGMAALVAEINAAHGRT